MAFYSTDRRFLFKFQGEKVAIEGLLRYPRRYSRSPNGKFLAVYQDHGTPGSIHIFKEGELIFNQQFRAPEVYQINDSGAFSFIERLFGEGEVSVFKVFSSAGEELFSHKVQGSLWANKFSEKRLITCFSTLSNLGLECGMIFLFDLFPKKLLWKKKNEFGKIIEIKIADETAHVEFVLENGNAFSFLINDPSIPPF